MSMEGRRMAEIDNDMTEDIFSKALSHTVEEVGIPNMRISLENNFEEIQKTHDSIHEFMYLAFLCVPSTGKINWYYSKSAFLIYHCEAFHSAHRSLLEALAGYYNPAYTLSRNTLELLARGAFWESLAHKKYRENTEIIDSDKLRDKKKRRSVKDWIEELIKQEPTIEKELEETSGAIFDKIAILFEDREFQNEYVRLPSFSLIVEQLIEWNIIDIPKANSVIYGNLYNELSKDVHVIPDNTDTGRRILLEKKFYELNIIPEELSKFMHVLRKVVDIGIVIELNILSDWIAQDKKIRDSLGGRLAVIENLGMKYSSDRLRRLMEYE